MKNNSLQITFSLSILKKLVKCRSLWPAKGFSAWQLCDLQSFLWWRSYYYCYLYENVFSKYLSVQDLIVKFILYWFIYRRLWAYTFKRQSYLAKALQDFRWVHDTVVVLERGLGTYPKFRYPRVIIPEPKFGYGLGLVCVWIPWVFLGWVPIKFKILVFWGY